LGNGRLKAYELKTEEEAERQNALQHGIG
jgi:hypothetical protein